MSAAWPSSVTKKLPQPLLGITWFYMLTSVLGVLAYTVLTFGCEMLGLHDFPAGTFGSRFHAYLLITVGLDDTITRNVGLPLLAVCIGWGIALLIACVIALWKKKYRFFQFMVLADIIATFGFLIYIFIRDEFYWGWFFSNTGYGLVLNLLYWIWLSRTIRTQSQTT